MGAEADGSGPTTRRGSNTLARRARARRAIAGVTELDQGIGVRVAAPPTVAPPRHGVDDDNAHLERATAESTARPAGRLGAHSLGPPMVLFTGLALIYSMFATGATGRFGPGEFPHHDRLGEAFLSGRLDLSVTRPELLALPNPYDPVQNTVYRMPDMHDLSLYKDRLYPYWGPAPALVHALWRLATQHALYASVAQVGATVAACVTFWLILGRLRERYFPNSAPWLVWGSSVAFALGGTMLFMVGRPSVYHEAQLFAMGFMLPSWYLFLVASEGGARRRRYLLWSGVLVGAAVGSRFTYLAYGLGIGLVLAWALARAERRARRPALLDLAAFGTPIGLVVLLLLLYNLVRFDAPLEFGTRYILQGSAWWYETTRLPDGTYGPLFVLALLIPHLALYLFGIPEVGPLYPYFPFAAAYAGFPYPGTGFMFPDIRQYTASYLEPPIISVFLLAPVSCLAPFSSLIILRRRLPGEGAVRAWAAGVLLGLLAMLPLLSASRGVTARYAVDIVPAFTLLGSLILLAGSAGVIGKGTAVRSLLPTFAVAGWALSMLLGALLGLGVWVYGFGPQALRMQSISNETVARLSTALRPDSVGRWTAPADRATWRHVDGRYLKDGTVYLRSPGPGTVLFVDFFSEAPAGTEVVIWVNGEVVMRGPMLAGKQVWWTPPLASASADAIVPIRLELPSQAAHAPGSRLPVVISSLRLTASQEEADRYRQSVRQ